jgi:inhibitor of cysteine peptidase
MKIPPFFLTVCLVCLLAAAVTIAGCTGTGNRPGQTTQPTPLGTAVPVSHIVVTEEQNKATIYVNQSNIITVKLPENPTTGYQWNLTTTAGLSVMNDTYVASDTTGKIVGSGGIHVWDISAVAHGEQKIAAVYKRSWEPLAGNETTFSMTVMVT